MMLPAATSMMLLPDGVRRMLLSGDNYFSGTVSLYRRSALQALGGLDVKLGSFSDAFLARRLALTFGFYFVAEILGYWRIHGQNYSTTTATDPIALEAKLAEVGALISQSDLFPPGYETLFARRTRFGASRMVLGTETPAAAKAALTAKLLAVGVADAKVLQLLLGFGPPGRVAALAWTTLRTRPMSLTRLLSQIPARRAIIAATSAYRAP